MPIILRAVSLDDVPLTQSISARFEADGGTIGRADVNTMALPDPERHISRQQAQIAMAPEGFTIRNVGAANPILVRNLRLMQGETLPIRHLDQVRIGGYLLEVVDLGDAEGDTISNGPVAKASPTPESPFGRPPAQALRPSAGFGDVNAPLSGDNPFADLLQVTPPAASATAPRERPASPAPAPSAPPSPGAAFPQSSARLPDDFDPFGQLPDAPAKPAADPARVRGVFGDLIPDTGPSSLDEMFGLGKAGAPDLLAAFSSEAPPHSTSEGRAASVDPLVLFDRQRQPAPVSADPTVGDDVPEVRAAFRPPRPLGPAEVEAPARAPVRPAARSMPTGTAADGAPLWAAFCEGARLRPERCREPDVEAMRSIGALLRAAVEGTMQLITVRSATRHELHAQVTVIKPRDNNPLKFSPDAQSALEQLMQPPLRGFLAGPEAMTDAMADLVSHAIGSMAGTRAALEGVLARFAPEELEAKIETRSLLDSVLPGHRKAKLWELYRQHYGAIREEAQEDFHALFGKAFLAAYEQQLERLMHDKNASSFE